ncbi:MAG: PAC2 family protein [Corynebacterium sp.]|nr:PAC2 family protein [Corynebacterium sp.]
MVDNEGNNRPMYELEFPSPDMSQNTSASGITMVIALQGYADAGHAIEATSDHILSSLDHWLVASFNADELIDYRSRRPMVTLQNGQIHEVEELELGLHIIRDKDGNPFLLLSGPEPDMRWESFTQAVVDLTERFGVTTTVALYSAPMAVPHTRPMIVTGHGNDASVVGNHVRLDETLHLPGSAALTIEAALHQAGRTVGGFTAFVPNYISGSYYPEAVINLLRSVEQVARVDIPMTTLERDEERVARELAAQTEASTEVQQIVGIMEEQYDHRIEEYHHKHPDAALPGEAGVPSAEELGAEFENFLAQVDSPRGIAPSVTDTPVTAASEDDEPAPSASTDDDTAPPASDDDGGHRHWWPGFRLF